MNNIVIGQYIPGDSWIYRIDPRIKLSALVILLVTTFLLNSFLLMSIMFVLMIIMFLSSSVPFMKMIRGLKPLMFLLTFTFFIQIFSVRTGRLLFEQQMYISYSSLGAIAAITILYFGLKRFTRFRVTYFLMMVLLAFVVQVLLPYGPISEYTFQIYEGGLSQTGFFLFRIIIVVILSSLLTFTTMPTDITNGLESLLKPLKVIRFPVSELAMMLSLTLRFIPTLLEETGKIMKAQASRGVDFNESKFKDKVSQVISLLIPIFVVSFKRAEDLANAMEARGYIVGGKRTKIDVMKFRMIDLVAIVVCFSLLTLSILLRTGVIHIAL